MPVDRLKSREVIRKALETYDDWRPQSSEMHFGVHVGYSYFTVRAVLKEMLAAGEVTRESIRKGNGVQHIYRLVEVSIESDR
jgi:hypothetical protein